jgi:hypothetical protein
MLNQVNSLQHRNYAFLATDDSAQGKRKKKSNAALYITATTVGLTTAGAGVNNYNRHQQRIDNYSTAQAVRTVIADMQKTGSALQGAHLKNEETGQVIRYYDKDGNLISTTLRDDVNGKAVIRDIDSIGKHHANVNSFVYGQDGVRNPIAYFEDKGNDKHCIDLSTGEVKELGQ